MERLRTIATGCPGAAVPVAAPGEVVDVAEEVEDEDSSFRNGTDA